MGLCLILVQQCCFLSRRDNPYWHRCSEEERHLDSLVSLRETKLVKLVDIQKLHELQILLALHIVDISCHISCYAVPDSSSLPHIRWQIFCGAFIFQANAWSFVILGSRTSFSSSASSKFRATQYSDLTVYCPFLVQFQKYNLVIGHIKTT